MERKRMTICGTLVLVLASSAGLANVNEDFTWTYKAPMIHGKGSGAAAAVGDMIYVFGGHTEPWTSPYGRICEAYDSLSDTWAPIADLPHSDGRYGMPAIAVGGKAYTFGGTNIVGNYNNTNIDEYDPGTDTWIANKATYPVSISVPGLAAYDGKIYCFGGGFYQAHDWWADNVYEYDPVTNTVTAKASMPTKRGIAYAATVGDKIYVIGGLGGYDASDPLTVVEVYDPVADQWTTGCAPIPTGGDVGGGVINNRIYVVVHRTNEVWEYDPSTCNWTQKNSIQTARAGQCVAVVDNRLYVLGGFTYPSGGIHSSVEEGVLGPQWCPGTEGSLGEGLVAYYPFEGNADDVSGNGNNGTEQGGPSYVGGVCGEAISLDGASYVAVPDSPSLDLPGGSGTIAAFIRVDPASNMSNEFGVSKESSSSYPSTIAYELLVRESASGKMVEYYLISDGTSCDYITNEDGESLKDSLWHHIALTWSGPGGKVLAYRDGVVVGQTDQTIATINNIPEPVLIGAFRWNVPPGILRIMIGELDDVRIYDRALSAEEIEELYGAEPGDGQVAHWKFDEGSGSVAYDSAGDNDGTIYGATWADGVLGGALGFDGAHDYVDCGNNDSLDITDELTISAWIKRPDFSTPGTIAGKTNGNSVTAGYALFSHIEGLEFSFYSQGWKRTIPRVAVTANQWHHVAGTFNGNIAYLYVDGEQGASIAYNGAITVAAGYPVLIGYWRSQLTAYFNGQIDDVRIYDVALSAEEVLALYEPYRPGKTYHVDGLNGSDGWDGLTAETAFETIQKGIDTAQDRDTVAVWPWVYVERINFEGKAITVKSADYPAVIEAPWNDAVSFDLGEGPSSALSNFVIRDSGTAVACSGASRPTLKNLTIVDNDLGIAAYDGSDPNITNCILWNNINGDLLGCEAEYSLAEQDVSNPIAEAPLFADFDGGDYHLLSENGRYVPAYGLWAFDDETSPCVDGGDPGEDPYGERMPNGGRINMGAYGGTAYASMSEWPLAHDENKDGRTDFRDFASLCDEWLLELAWAAPPGTPAADRTPPEPDPATWDIEPYATSSTSILMAATAATDENGVEYYFENMTIGGHARSWQASANWGDSSLASSTKYCYRVKTRDKSPNANESRWSSTLCATTSSGGR